MPTNREWLNQMAQEDPAALAAWFDSERSDAEEYRERLGRVMDCVCEALRVGTLGAASIVDEDGEVL